MFFIFYLNEGFFSSLKTGKLKKKMKKEKEKVDTNLKLFLAGFILVLLSISFVFAADPEYADSIQYGTNETKNSSSALYANVSGGYIANFNLSTTVQNPRWKAFIGNVIGAFTLDDASGSTIYDWTFSTGTGRVYATRNSGAINWAGIDCANVTDLESENLALSLDNPDDNITSTFSDTTHDPFPVGGIPIAGDTCPTLNTYRNGDKTQDAGNPFEEMVLGDGSSLVFATIIEDDVLGYNGENYDFQMIVPENGSISFTGNTLYYLYVELGS